MLQVRVDLPSFVEFYGHASNNFHLSSDVCILGMFESLHYVFLNCNIIPLLRLVFLACSVEQWYF